ncbi:MAG: protein kinase [Gemmataceae bacterium]|nr:protein kinase [Gemmataceae bacterium]
MLSLVGEASFPSRRVALAPKAMEPTRRVPDPSFAEAILSAAPGQRAPEVERLLPSVGDKFLGFELVDELGKGSFGTVFLATQSELADRPVALKISADLFGEPAKLARLQHASIMPVYSTHATAHLQAVCMPFFGRATVGDLYTSLRSLGTLPQSGQHLVSTLESKRRPGSAAPSTRSAPDSALDHVAETQELPVPLASLSRLSYIDAILLTASRIADGLAHAHERGIVHQDLKPANILLTDEGMPMILDFNLAREADPERLAILAQVGGTIPYMSPEQLEQFATKQADPSRPVDGRSDIYALGLIMYQLLAGAPPCVLPSGPVKVQLPVWLAMRRAALPSLRKANPEVPPAVESIVRKCLEHDPARRYQSARDLAEDIARHRADLPLRHAPNPSLAERFRKWWRRNPKFVLGLGLVLAAVLAVGVAVAAAHSAAEAQKRQDAALTTAGREKIAAFHEAMGKVEPALASDVGLRAAAEAAEEALAALGTDDPRWLSRPEFARLMEEERDKLESSVGELALQAAAAWVRIGETERAAKADALAARCLGPRVADDFPKAVQAMKRGDLKEAKGLLLRAGRERPGEPAIWMRLGLVHERLQEPAGARRAYGFALSADPRCVPAYAHRAAAWEALGDREEALADLGEALRLEPGTAHLRLRRAALLHGLGRDKAAKEDLDAVLAGKPVPLHAWLLRAAVRRKLGDEAGAEADREKAASLKPADAADFVARGHARPAKEAKEAMADYEAAEKLSPRALEPLQKQVFMEGEVFGKPARAAAVLDRLLKQHPHHVPGLCGRAVYLARAGRFDEAVADAKRALALSDTPFTQYRAGCVYALASAKKPALAKEALRLVAKALAKGEGWEFVPGDTDLDPLRKDARFKPLAALAKHLAELLR